MKVLVIDGACTSEWDVAKLNEQAVIDFCMCPEDVDAWREECEDEDAVTGITHEIIAGQEIYTFFNYDGEAVFFIRPL